MDIKEDPKESDRRRKREYYHGHREKMETYKKRVNTKSNEEKCLQQQVPVVLAPYISFLAPTKYKPDRVGLKFDSIHDMLSFLSMLMYQTPVSHDELEKLITFHGEQQNGQTK